MKTAVYGSAGCTLVGVAVVGLLAADWCLVVTAVLGAWGWKVAIDHARGVAS